jgi:hypothetical protein
LRIYNFKEILWDLISCSRCFKVVKIPRCLLSNVIINYIYGVIKEYHPF